MILRGESDADLAEWWRRVQSVLDRHEDELAARLATATLRALRGIADAIKEGRQVDLAAFADAHGGELARIFATELWLTAQTFGGAIMREAGQAEHAEDWIAISGVSAAVLAGAKLAADRYAAATARRVGKLATMKPHSRAAAWAQLVGIINARRARDAAAAEVHATSQLATVEAGSMVGKVRKRMWVSRLDGKERPAHHAAHKQVVGLTELYLVGGERLRFPGDPRVSPGNWINCRCASALILET